MIDRQGDRVVNLTAAAWKGGSRYGGGNHIFSDTDDVHRAVVGIFINSIFNFAYNSPSVISDSDKGYKVTVGRRLALGDWIVTMAGLCNIKSFTLLSL